MKRRLIAGILAVVVTIVAGLMFFGFIITHEKVEKEIDLGPEPEVVANPFLAMETFLERLEVDIKTTPDPHEPAQLDAMDVVILDPEFAVYERFRRHLVDEWLPQGGHLIVLPPGAEEDREQELVEELDLKVHLQWQHFVDDEPQWPEESKSWQPRVTRTYEEVSRKSDWDAMEAGGLWGWDFERWQTTAWGPREPDFIAATADDAPIVISSAHGDGRISVVSHQDWVTNQGLATEGMGTVWADVLATGETWPDRALIFARSHPEGWISRLWSAGWPFFVGLLLWLAFAFTRARRFGPTVPEPERRRQRRGDHIRATGHFLWHHHGRDVLADATRRALVEALQKRRPSIQTMTPSKRYEVMAEELQIEPNELRRLLESPVPRRPAEFQTLIARLETLRRNL